MKAIQKHLKNKHLGTKVSAKEYEKIVKLVESGEYLSVSDFVRESIREKLEGLEVIEVRDVDRETAKKEILDYYKIHKEAYPTEVANALCLDLELTWNITDELMRNGTLKVVE